MSSVQPEGATTEEFPRPVGTSTSWATHRPPHKATHITRKIGTKRSANLENPCMLPPHRDGLLFSIAIQHRCILAKENDFRHSQSRRTHHNASDGPNHAAAKCLIFFTFRHGSR